jgi:xanthine dehydrogenase accessory factor
MEIQGAIERWHARGEQVALATVVETRRSAPRPVGAHMAVSETGELFGSLSGGCVEAEVAEHAREILPGGRPRLLTYGIEDDVAWGVGLPCGGEIDVFVEPLTPQTPLAAPEGSALGTVVAGGRAGEKRVVCAGEDPDVDDRLRARRSGVVGRGDETLFCAVFPPRLRLLVFGAVDLAEALARTARSLGWRTIVADPRAALVTRERIPSADELLVCLAGRSARSDRPRCRKPRSSSSRMTRSSICPRSPARDGRVLHRRARIEADARTAPRAPARTRSRRGDLGRIAGPCGLDLGAESAAETALSILAEVVAARNGRTGGPLGEARRSIHAATA